MKNYSAILQRSLQLIVFIFLGLCAYEAFIFWCYSYNGFENYLITFFQKPHLKHVFEKKVTPATFKAAQWTFLVTTIALFLLNIVLTLQTNSYKWLAKQFIILVDKANKKVLVVFEFQDKIIQKAWWFLVTLFLVQSIYWMATYPITLDEATTYVLFSSKGVLFAMGYYPTTNNHFLFSVISVFFAKLPFSPSLAIRLANLPSSFFCICSLTYFFKKYANEKWMLLGVAFFISTPIAINYSIEARGYMYLLLFCSISLLLQLGFIEGRVSRRRLYVFTLISVLGTYTVPTYLYFLIPTLAVTVFWILTKKEYRLVIRILQHVILSAFILCFLFVPLFFTTGIDVAIEMANAKPNTERIHDNIINALKLNLSCNLLMLCFFMGLIFLTLFFLLSKKKNHPITLIILANISFLILIVEMLHKKSFDRNWVHLSLLFSLPIPLALNYFFKHVTNRAILVSLALLFTLNYAAFLQFGWFLPNKKVVTEEKQTAALIASYNASNIYFDDQYIKIFMDYYFVHSKKNYSFHTSNRSFIYAAPYSMNANYDAIIHNHEAEEISIPSNYLLVLNGAVFDLFIRKDLVK